MLQALRAAYTDLKVADGLSRRNKPLPALKRYEAALPVLREQLGAEHFITNAVYCKLAVAQEQVRSLVKASVPAFTAPHLVAADEIEEWAAQHALVTLLYVAAAEQWQPTQFLRRLWATGQFEKENDVRMVNTIARGLAALQLRTMEANGVDLDAHLRAIVQEVATKAIAEHGRDTLTVRIAAAKLLHGQSSAAKFLKTIDAQSSAGEVAAFEILVDAVTFNKQQASIRRPRRARPTRSNCGTSGVYVDKRTGKYRAYWTENTESKHVPGKFDTVAEAAAARDIFMKKAADAAITDILTAAKHADADERPKKTTRRGAAARGGGATVEVWDMCGAASERF